MKKLYLLLSIGAVLYYSTAAPKNLEKSKQLYTHHNAITELLDKYKRPITVLEIGANKHALSFDIANNYDATCVIIEENTTQDVLTTCKKQNKENIIVLHKKLSTELLEQLGECEHFDVVLVWNSDHLCGKKWQRTLNALLTLGDHIVIETNNNTVATYLKENNAIHITTSHKNSLHQTGDLFLCSMYKKSLIRKWLNDSRLYKPGIYTIHSTFEEKQLHKKQFGKIHITSWEPGINLWTYKELDGVYPSKKQTISLLEPLKYIEHTSLSIYNIIIQGNRPLIPIDYNERKENKKDMPKVVEKIQNHFK